MSLRVFALVIATGVALSACTQSNNVIVRSVPKKAPHINNTTKFTAAAYGVAASPRLTTSRNVRKGGGRRQIGKPYKIRGKWYTPREQPGYDRTGNASWYGPNFHGRLTANGEIYDQFALTAAHPTFPLPSYARVTNVENGNTVIVRVNDRGPYHAGRIIDLSARASSMLDYQKKGIGRVRVQYIGEAPLHGLDANYLEASYQPGNLVTASAKNQSDQTNGQLDADRRKAKIQLARDVDPIKTASTVKSEGFAEALKSAKDRTDDGSTLALRIRNLRSESLK